jgi:hypothetical protein
MHLLTAIPIASKKVMSTSQPTGGPKGGQYLSRPNQLLHAPSLRHRTEQQAGLSKGPHRATALWS